MHNPKNINDELKELNSSLSAGSNGTPYYVPEGYFEGFAASVMSKINEASISASDEISELSPLLAGLSKNNPYSVPSGYFSTSLETLPGIISEEDSLILSFVEKDQPYEVPLGYFASFPDKVMEKVGDRKTKVVSFGKQKWMRLAVAAMVTGIIAISGITYFNRGSDVKAGNDPVAVEINKASTEELNAFITTTSVIPAEENSTAQNTADVKELLEDVSDKELEAFLDQVPTDDGAFDLN